MTTQQSRELIRSQVIDFLAEFTKKPQLRELTGDVRLSECGLDSFGMFEFVLALEGRFGITIDDAGFDVRNFQSVDAIVTYLGGLPLPEGGRP